MANTPSDEGPKPLEAEIVDSLYALADLISHAPSEKLALIASVFLPKWLTVRNQILAASEGQTNVKATVSGDADPDIRRVWPSDKFELAEAKRNAVVVCIGKQAGSASTATIFNQLNAAGANVERGSLTSLLNRMKGTKEEPGLLASHPTRVGWFSLTEQGQKVFRDLLPSRS